MSLVFRGNFVKLYPDVDRRFTKQFDPKFTYIYQEKRYFLAKLNQLWIVDVLLFTLVISDVHEQEL